MALTATTPTSAADKGWMDFLGDILPGAASAGASFLGIDPRVAGQTVSQVMSIFGIGKAFTTQVAKDQAGAQLREIVAPHLEDEAFKKALGLWLQTAIQPIQAHKEGKDYTPDLSKSWFSDAWDTVTDTVSDVDWGKVTQVGMQALPFVLAVL